MSILKFIFNKRLLSQIIIMWLVLLFSGCNESNPKTILIKIGTSDVMDLFHSTGEILARIINTDIARNDIIAENITTLGSGENIRRLFANTLICALVNDILAVMAYKGNGPYKKFINHNKLRSITSFFNDCICFIVNTNSGIKSFADIKGKRIGIAASGASINDIYGYILEYYKIKEDDFVRMPYGYTKSVIELEKGNIDGFLFITSHPAPFISGLTSSNKNKYEFIPFSKDFMKYVKKEYPYLTYSKISAKTYSNNLNQKEITTLGSRALLLTMENMDFDTVYYLTKEICKYFSAYENVHPVYKEVTPESMAKNLTIPVHPGAYKYYKEAGLAKYIPKDLLPRDQ